MQSPKSMRPSAPGESAPDDGNPSPSTERRYSNEGGPQKKPSVPTHDDAGASGFKGGTQSNQDMPHTSGSTPHQGGGPGFVKDLKDANRKGGTPHRT